MFRTPIFLTILNLKSVDFEILLRRLNSTISRTFWVYFWQNSGRIAPALQFLLIFSWVVHFLTFSESFGSLTKFFCVYTSICLAIQFSLFLPNFGAADVCLHCLSSHQLFVDFVYFLLEPNLWIRLIEHTDK